MSRTAAASRASRARRARVASAIRARVASAIRARVAITIRARVACGARRLAVAAIVWCIGRVGTTRGGAVRCRVVRRACLATGLRRDKGGVGIPTTPAVVLVSGRVAAASRVAAGIESHARCQGQDVPTAARAAAGQGGRWRLHALAWRAEEDGAAAATAAATTAAAATAAATATAAVAIASSAGTGAAGWGCELWALWALHRPQNQRLRWRRRRRRRRLRWVFRRDTPTRQ